MSTAVVTVSPDTPVEDVGSWPEWRRREIEVAIAGNGRVGSMLASETERVRVWTISLKPGERLAFHKHVLDYFWTATAAGTTRSYYSDGRIGVSSVKPGDTRHYSFGKGEYMVHDLENIGSTVVSYVTVELKQSANAPLPLA